MAAPKDFHIAIIGGGIAGLTLALALHARNVPFTLYERAARFEEIGAGVSLLPNAVAAMKQCHPGVYAAFEKVCTRNGWASKQTTWFDFVDGYRGGRLHDGFTITTPLGQNGVHRASFLDEMAKLLPSNRAEFGKMIEQVEERADGRLRMLFADGTEAVADAVIGCDGIRSKVRQFVVGAGHPSVHPGYSYKYAYRGVIPMHQAIDAVGEERAQNATIYMGEDGHVLTFPVALGSKLNIVAFRTGTDPWDSDRLTKSARREDALRDFKDYDPQVLKLLSHTEEELLVWAIFDLHDHPVPTFFKDRICISGDAAHATSPHHGAGAGFCIEDSAVLADLLTDSRVQSGNDLAAVFAAFDENRRERCQWLVRSSRIIGDCYEWRYEGSGSDFAKMEKVINDRIDIICKIDLEQSTKAAIDDLHNRLARI